MKTAILTISTSVARGASEDESGPVLVQLAAAAGAEIVAHEVVSDDTEAIEERLRASGVDVRRFKKPTFTKPAPIDLRYEIATQCDVVIEALAD